MPSTTLSKADFTLRYHTQFFDPTFDAVRDELKQIADIAWDNYEQSRKSPVTLKAGPDFANPDYDLSVEWSVSRDTIAAAQKQHDNASLPSRILLINGSSRSDHTCPGEMSKSYRMIEIAQDALELEYGVAVDVLDLSRLSGEYGRRIHPCKACFSTAAPLCHWPCSCYPNHAMGQMSLCH